jgi:tRNA 2-selenouridine synthase
MNNAQGVPDFLSAVQEGRVLLDVRSPGEFAQGHVPGAISFPLFSDEERAQVGTKYKQVGKEAAFELGLGIVGPKMEGFVRDARRLAPDRRLAVHCWRGGQRSGSMAWLLRAAGHDVVTLVGGYKNYRSEVLSFFEQQAFQYRVVGGSTGSGKTKVLHALHSIGQQVLDLEGVANHKGSAFGWIGEAPQPTSEQFENECHAILCRFDIERPVWLENESRSIGKVFIPQGLWDRMRIAPLDNIQVPDEDRIKNLLEDYVGTDKTDLVASFQKIARKLGGLQLTNALDALDQDDYEAAARIALTYYDKTYQHCLNVNISPEINHLTFDHGDPMVIARSLVAAAAR